MRIRVLFGSNPEIYRIPCDDIEKTVDVIDRAIETYKKCNGKEKYNVSVKYLKNTHGESIIVDNSKIKNACDDNEEVTAIFEEAFHVPKSLDILKNPFY